MERHDAPMRHNVAHGLTLTEMLAILVMLIIFAAVLSPLLRHTRSAPSGVVRNSSGRPIPGAILRFRDPSGRVAAIISTNEEGKFERSDLDRLSRNAVDGFELSDFIHRSGNSDLYVFTRLETKTANFREESGKPIPGLAVAFGPDHNTWQHHEREPFQAVSNRLGIIQIHQHSMGISIEFQSLNPRYIVERFQETDDGQAIRYAVTLTKPSTVTGCLRGQDGQPLLGYKAFATISPDLDRFDRWYADSLATGPTGRFRITNLRPRAYYVSATPAHGYHAVAPAQRVTLASDQTVEVNLRADATDKTPNAQ